MGEKPRSDPDGAFVRYPEFLDKHLDHEKRIATNTEKLNELTLNMSLITTKLDNISKDVNDHVKKEDAIWIEFRGEVKELRTDLKAIANKITNPVYTRRQIWTFVLSMVGIAVAVAEVLHYSHWPLP